MGAFADRGTGDVDRERDVGCDGAVEQDLDRGALSMGAFADRGTGDVDRERDVGCDGADERVVDRGAGWRDVDRGIRGLYLAGSALTK
jgi:hypothetical protein